MNIVKYFASAALTTLLATSGYAQDTGNEAEVPVPGSKGFYIYNQVGEWRVLEDTERKTCLVEKFDADGNAVQIGLGPKGKRAYLGVFTKLPEDLRGKYEKLVVTVDVNDKTYKGRIKFAQRKTYTDYAGIYIPAKNLDIAALATDGTQTMSFPDRELEINFSMTGAVDAVAAAKQCHAEMNT